MEMQNEGPENAGTAGEQRANLQNAKAAGWLALAERCEKATGPDRELDGDIAHVAKQFVDYLPRVPERPWLWAEFVEPDDWECWEAPEYTASLDAITALIEREFPEWAYVLDTRNVAAWLTPYARLFRPGEIATGSPPSGKAATPALSLSAAFCRAMAQKESRS